MKNLILTKVSTDAIVHLLVIKNNFFLRVEIVVIWLVVVHLLAIRIHLRRLLTVIHVVVPHLIVVFDLGVFFLHKFVQHF